jgi:hypothetical protein
MSCISAYNNFGSIIAFEGKKKRKESEKPLTTAVTEPQTRNDQTRPPTSMADLLEYQNNFY